MFCYTLYYDGGLLTDRSGYESRDEAEEEAIDEINNRVDYWKTEGAWDETDNRAYFEYVIYEEEE